MDQKSIEAEIKKNLLFEGELMKRSKFLKQWRKRWVVLTSNFLMTFTNKKYQQMTDVVEVKQINGLKSYLKKEDDLTPTSFKIQSTQNTLHFMAESAPEKWTWMVIIQRLLDFKFSNSTQCKSVTDVRQMGFDSLNGFLDKSKGGKKEEKKEETEEKSQNYEKVVKMVELFRSQEAENRKLRAQISQLVRNLQQKCAQEEQTQMVKKIGKMHEQNGNNQDFQHLQGMIKGMIIGKKLEKDNANSIKEIVKVMMEQCQKQTTLNWVSQLKQLY